MTAPVAMATTGKDIARTLVDVSGLPLVDNRIYLVSLGYLVCHNSQNGIISTAVSEAVATSLMHCAQKQGCYPILFEVFRAHIDERNHLLLYVTPANPYSVDRVEMILETTVQATQMLHVQFAEHEMFLDVGALPKRFASAFAGCQIPSAQLLIGDNIITASLIQHESPSFASKQVSSAPDVGPQPFHKPPRP